MPTTAQPSAGTALPSNSLTTGLVHARNEADTTATTVLAGTATRSIIGTGPVWVTDAQGRGKLGTAAGDSEYWAQATSFFGPEYTLMTICKLVTGGANQALLDSDNNPPRNLLFRANTSNGFDFIPFDTAGTNYSLTPAGTISTSGYSVAIGRVRNDAGTYRAKAWLDGNASSEVALATTPESVDGGERLYLGDRWGGSHQNTGVPVYFSAVWNRALSDTEIAGLQANPWSIFDSGATTPTITSIDGTSPVEGLNLTINGSNFGASQGTQQLFIGGVLQDIVSWVDNKIITAAIDIGTNLFGGTVAVEIWDAGSLVSNSFSVPGFQPQSEWTWVNIATPNTTSPYRITAVSDIASGDQLCVQGWGGRVVPLDDATFSAADGILGFLARVGVPGSGYGTPGEQILVTLYGSRGQWDCELIAKAWY